MRDKIRYSNEPMQAGEVIADFLPPPDQLVLKEDAVKVTISLSTRSVHFFKKEAARHGVQYQRMIRRLLDAYVEAFERSGTGASQSDRPRAEQAPGAYNRLEKKREKKKRSGSKT